MSAGQDPEMDRRSWPWKRRSSEKSLGETESSGSASTHSERYSNDLEASKPSPNHGQSPEVSSNISPSQAHSPEDSSDATLNDAQSPDCSFKVSPNHAKPPEVSSNIYPNQSPSSEVSSNISTNNVQSPEVSLDIFPSLAQSPEASSNSSTNGAKSAEVLSRVVCCQQHGTIKNLTDKLSTTLSKLGAQEDLVKQHAKVAEEAVSGWEKAEVEVTNMKQQLETAATKNSALEDRINQLDGALKECVRQLRQARDEQQQKIHDAVTRKTNEWDTEKFELESRIVELESLLDVAKAKFSSVNHEFQLKLEAMYNKNSSLKHELLSRSEQVRVRTVERELSIQAAEAASKQHLESIKKMAKLEAECRRLRAVIRKKQSSNDHKSIASTVYMESLTDSQSDSGERMQSLDNEPSCSDSWASSLILELDRFKNEKSPGKDIVTSSVEMDIMDDFLEMERLAASHNEANQSNSFSEHRADTNGTCAVNSASKDELEAMFRRTDMLEEKVARMETEKQELEILLACTQEKLGTTSIQLKESEVKLLELQRLLDSARASKHVSEIAVEASEAKARALQTQLDVVNSKFQQLNEIVNLLEGKADKEKNIAEEFARKCQKLEAELSASGSDIQQLRTKMGLLEGKVDEERLMAKESALKCKGLEEELSISDNELQQLHEKVYLLEEKAEGEKVLSEEFAMKCQILEDKLSSSNLEVQQLLQKMTILERKVEEEKVLAEQFALKCQKLEDEDLKRKQEAELQRAANSNEELKMKQESELAVAAGKLAECQQTIASLGRQLKSLANMNDFLFQAEMPENGKSPHSTEDALAKSHLNEYLISSNSSLLSNGKERWTQPCTSSVGFSKSLS